VADGLVTVRCMVDDVENAVEFYTHPHPRPRHGALQLRARVRRVRARQPTYQMHSRALSWRSGNELPLPA
jgi:hypothetical protein